MNKSIDPLTFEEIPSNSQNKSKPSSTKKNQKPKKKSNKKNFFKKLFYFCFFSGLAGAVAVIAFVFWLSQDLPSITKIADFKPPLSTTILARDGSVIGEIYNERRYLISLDQVPEYVPMAFVSAEDKDFYTHQGVSIQAILRAAIANFSSGSTTQGGSTITQQVVKRLLLTPERTYTRKIKEALLAFQLERQLSKNDILTIYLNQIHMGGVSYGIEAGARYYFAKNAPDLTIAESALLAGILPATTRYNPYRNPEAARNRQVYVLGRMREDGIISDAQYEEAYYEELKFISMDELIPPVGGWYVEEVRRQLIELFSEESSKAHGFDYGVYGEQAVSELGLTVQTSMDVKIQEYAEIALKHGLDNATKRHGWRGPIDNLEPLQYDEYLAKSKFTLEKLADNAWVDALVTKVERKGAEVQLNSEYKGYIDVVSMGWAREPDIEASGSEFSRVVNDARDVLKAGDIVKVRLYSPYEKAVFIDKTTPKKKNDQEEPVDFSSYVTAEVLIPTLSTESIIPLALEQVPNVEGALIAIEPTNFDVVALVGGYKFGASGSHFNRAIQAKRQTGSAFKPIVYSTALDNGYTQTSEVLDAPIVLINPFDNEVWRPSNFSSGFSGKTTVRNALAKSINLVTVRIAQEVTMAAIVERAQALGLEGLVRENLAVSLGAFEATPVSIAKSYATFVNHGQAAEPRFIQNIKGQWGNVIYEPKPEFVEVISPQNAYLMTNMLENVVQNGTGGSIKDITETALGGKTGTTNDEVDAWFTGITPHLVTTTYVGYDQPKPMGRGETGARTAVPIYKEFATKALPLYPVAEFPIPEGITFYDVKGVSIPFAEGTLPAKFVEPVAPEITQPDGFEEQEQIQKVDEKDKVEATDDLLRQLF